MDRTFQTLDQLEEATISANKKNTANENESIHELLSRRASAQMGGGEKRIKAQHDRGKLTARERLNLLFDKGSFTELDPFVTNTTTQESLGRQVFEGDSVVTGFGTIDGRHVFAYAQDFTVLGGSLSYAAAKKISKLMDHAMRTGVPVVGINDSGGARIQDGVDSLAGYGEIFKRNTLASGVIPQITMIAGPAAGGAVYSPAITDYIFMVENISQMYITGPDVVKAVTGEDITHEDLGGTLTHAVTSGVSHFVAKDEPECLLQIRRLLSFLPSNNTEMAPSVSVNEQPDLEDNALNNVVPTNASQPYDVMDVINRVVDDGDFLPVHSLFAKNIVVGFGRIDGKSIGIVANQPAVLAGMLDIDASDKAARFVRFCDAFNIPLLTFVDVPGFMPGVQQEYGGIIRHGAKLLYAYSEATVPKMAVVLRKAYGGAYIVMSSKELGSDLNLAWPTAEIAVMGPEGAVNIIERKKISESEKPQQTRENLVREYREKFANPFVAANKGYIDDVIVPSETRTILVKALRMFQTKIDTIPAKKHGNIPL